MKRYIWAWLTVMAAVFVVSFLASLLADYVMSKMIEQWIQYQLVGL